MTFFVKKLQEILSGQDDLRKKISKAINDYIFDEAINRALLNRFCEAAEFPKDKLNFWVAQLDELIKKTEIEYVKRQYNKKENISCIKSKKNLFLIINKLKNPYQVPSKLQLTPESMQLAYNFFEKMLFEGCKQLLELDGTINKKLMECLQLSDELNQNEIINRARKALVPLLACKLLDQVFLQWRSSLEEKEQQQLARYWRLSDISISNLKKAKYTVLSTLMKIIKGDVLYINNKLTEIIHRTIFLNQYVHSYLKNGHDVEAVKKIRITETKLLFDIVEIKTKNPACSSMEFYFFQAKNNLNMIDKAANNIFRYIGINFPDFAEEIVDKNFPADRKNVLLIEMGRADLVKNITQLREIKR